MVDNGERYAMTDVRIDRFAPEDQAGVRALVLDGLRERWGSLEPGLNRDLDDIGHAYSSGLVLVARFGDRIVGCRRVAPRLVCT